MVKSVCIVLIAGLLATSGLIGKVCAVLEEGESEETFTIAAVIPTMGPAAGGQGDHTSFSSCSDVLTMEILTYLPFGDLFKSSRVSRGYRDALHRMDDHNIRAVLERTLDYNSLTERNHTIQSLEGRKFLENVQKFLNMWFQFEGNEEGFPQRVRSSLASLTPKGRMPFGEAKKVLEFLFNQDDGTVIEALSKTPDSFLDIFRPISWIEDPLITAPEPFPQWSRFFEAIAEQRPALFSKIFEKLPTFQAWPEFCALGPTQHRWLEIISQKHKAHFRTLIGQLPIFESWEDPSLSSPEMLQLINLISPMEQSHFVNSWLQKLPPLASWETAFSSASIPAILTCIHEADKLTRSSHCPQLLHALPAFLSWEDPAISSHDNIFGLLPLISEVDKPLLQRLVENLSPIQSWDHPALSSPVMESLSGFIFDANPERFLELFGNLPPLDSWSVALSLPVIPSFLDMMHQRAPGNFQRLVGNLTPFQSWTDPSLSSPHLRDILIFLDMMKQVNRPLFLHLTQHLNRPNETLGYSGSYIRREIFSIIEEERSRSTP
jgi:hypothetical protein